MSDYVNDGYELGWDAEIENEGKEFVVAEPGDYDFTVTGFERSRHGGSEKMPPCNKAILTIRLDVPNANGECIIKHNLFLHSKSEWRLCEFFTSIGQRRKGQRVSMNWNAVVGSKGRCKVKKRSFKSNSGNDLWTNDIEKFYAPSENLPFHTANVPQTSPAPATGGYTVGKF